MVASSTMSVRRGGQDALEFVEMAAQVAARFRFADIRPERGGHFIARNRGRALEQQIDQQRLCPGQTLQPIGLIVQRKMKPPQQVDLQHRWLRRWSSAETDNVCGDPSSIPGMGAGGSPDGTWRRPFPECCVFTAQAACICTRSHNLTSERLRERLPRPGWRRAGAQPVPQPCRPECRYACAWCAPRRAPA